PDGDQGGAAVRVVIAEDSVLLREGLARLLADGGVEVVAQVGDGPGLVAAVDAYRPDLAVVDVRMPPSHTDEGLRGAMEVRERAPPPPSWSCPSTWRSATPPTCSPAAPRGSATCSRTGWPTWPSSRPPSAGSATAGPPSTPRSPPSGWAARVPGGRRPAAGPPPPRRPPGLPQPPRARRPLPHGRGPQQRRHRRAPGHHRGGRREAHLQHLRQARPPRRPLRPPPGPGGPHLPPGIGRPSAHQQCLSGRE